MINKIKFGPSEKGLILLLPTRSSVSIDTNFTLWPEKILAMVIVVVNEKPLGYRCMNSNATSFLTARNPEFKSGIFIPTK